MCTKYWKSPNLIQKKNNVCHNTVQENKVGFLQDLNHLNTQLQIDKLLAV